MNARYHSHMNSADMASLVPDPDDLLARSREDQAKLILRLLAPCDSPRKAVAHSDFFSRTNDPLWGKRTAPTLA